MSLLILPARKPGNRVAQQLDHYGGLTSADHTDLIGHVRSSARLAVTSGNVFTFQSVQLKGGVEALGPATAGEHDTAVELSRRLISRIAQVENLPTTMFDHRIPSAFVTCTIRVDSIFDQTPGPKAGLPLTDGSQ
jgi:hypothetical protein